MQASGHMGLTSRAILLRDVLVATCAVAPGVTQDANLAMTPDGHFRDATDGWQGLGEFGEALGFVAPPGGRIGVAAVREVVGERSCYCELKGASADLAARWLAREPTTLQQEARPSVDGRRDCRPDRHVQKMGAYPVPQTAFQRGS